jgi:hypothetical protein
VYPPHPDRSAALGPSSVTALQQLVGNAAVSHLLASAGEDRAQEDRGDVGVPRSTVQDVLGTPGRPLDESVRADMEARLGADFSGVRVHTDRAAHDSAESVNAQAYTSGSHIVFRHGRYGTASDSGRRLLAHELTHVVQQRSGPVAGTDTGDGLAISDPSDRFEREAERVAAEAMGGPAAQPTPAGGTARSPGTSTPVARMMSVEEFRNRTTRRFGLPRGHKIQPVEQALAAYHALPQDNYLARYRQLEVLRRAAERYLAESGSQRYRPAAETVIDQSHDEQNAIPRLRRFVEEALERAGAHQQIYQQLIDADRTADPSAALHRLLDAQEDILTQIALSNTGMDGDLGILNVRVGDWMNVLVNQLRQQPAALRPFIEDDLRLLTEMSTNPAVPLTTRRILAELLANRGITEFQAGSSPGTRLSAPGGTSKYTLGNPITQTLGRTERLGTLAHELTHVHAGEAYDNTAILLLFRPGTTDAEIGQLARRRRTAIDDLRRLLQAHQGFTGSQRQLFESKLKYTGDATLSNYAVKFHSTGKIDQTTFDQLIHFNKITEPNSGLLVEYDTVLNQLLIYLHQWEVDPQAPLYLEVLRLAEQARQEREP